MPSEYSYQYAKREEIERRVKKLPLKKLNLEDAKSFTKRKAKSDIKAARVVDSLLDSILEMFGL